MQNSISTVMKLPTDLRKKQPTKQKHRHEQNSTDLHQKEIPMLA